MIPQVSKSHYFGVNYITPSRFAVYAYQLTEIMALKPRNVLEIGIGNGLVSGMLRRSEISTTTLDFDKALCPDIVGSVTDLPFPFEHFDVVTCFEVLEHLPFTCFLTAVREIWRVTSHYAILSLPDCKHCFRLFLPKLGPRRFLWDWPFQRSAKHKFDGEHYWEINKQGYNLKDITALIEKADFSIDKTYRVWEMPHNRFFSLRKPGGE